VTANDVSPYLRRPIRSLEEAIAEAEQQRLETPPAPAAAAAQTGGELKSETVSSTASRHAPVRQRTLGATLIISSS